MPATHTSVLKRACDQCRFRRTKCSFGQPCSACVRSDLPQCTYLALPKKKGPKGSRIATLQAQGPSAPAALTFPDLPPIVGDPQDLWQDVSPSSDGARSMLAIDEPVSPLLLGPSRAGDHLDKLPGYELSLKGSIPCLSGFSQMGLPSRIGCPAVLTLERIGQLRQPVDFGPQSLPDPQLRQYIETFFDIVQPIIPFFSKRWLLDRIDQGLHVRVDSFFAMLLSISSLALIQPVLLWKAPGMFSNPIETGYILYREASRLHDLARTSDSLDHFSLFTSYFLFAVCTGMGKKTEAWLRLREALSIAEVLELDSLASDQIDEGDSQAFDLRVSLVLCITERCLALNHKRSLVLRKQPTMLLMAASPDSTLALDPSLIILAQLFDPINEEIFSCLSGTCRTSPPSIVCSLNSSKVVQLQRVFSLQMFSEASSIPALRLLDLLGTMFWLKTRIWQLGLSHSLLEVAHPDGRELEFDFIVGGIAEGLLTVLQSFPAEAREHNGISFMEKVADVRLSVMAVISSYALQPLVMQDPDGSRESRARTIHAELGNVLNTFRNGAHPYACFDG